MNVCRKLELLGRCWRGWVWQSSEKEPRKLCHRWFHESLKSWMRWEALKFNSRINCPFVTCCYVTIAILQVFQDVIVVCVCLLLSHVCTVTHSCSYRAHSLTFPSLDQTMEGFGVSLPFRLLPTRLSHSFSCFEQHCIWLVSPSCCCPLPST